MNAFFYILYSTRFDSFYIGSTTLLLEQRLINHNNNSYGRKSYTHFANDWQIVIQIKCHDYSHAIRMERKLKSMKSKKYIKCFIKYPELRDKIFSQTFEL